MSERRLSPMARMAVDVGPLAAFFAAYAMKGLMAATVVLMAATVAALAVSLIVERRVPLMPLVSAGLVLVFGALTLYLDDETFIKQKPTAVYLLFAAALLLGQAFGQSFLKKVLDTAFHLDARGWHILTLRWGGFFIFMAALNEFVWRGFSTELWVNVKVFGFLPLTLLFALMQAGLIRRHTVPAKDHADLR
jgi:intracellular septation protein